MSKHSIRVPWEPWIDQPAILCLPDRSQLLVEEIRAYGVWLDNDRQIRPQRSRMAVSVRLFGKQEWRFHVLGHSKACPPLSPFFVSKLQFVTQIILSKEIKKRRSLHRSDVSWNCALDERNMVCSPVKCLHIRPTYLSWIEILKWKNDIGNRRYAARMNWPILSTSKKKKSQR